MYNNNTFTRSLSSSRLREYESQPPQSQYVQETSEYTQQYVPQRHPPGFSSLSEYGISIRNNSGSAPPPGFFDSENRHRQAMKLDPGMFLSGQTEERSSFVNLAAVLGEGLAESIGDEKAHGSVNEYHNTVDNYQRQSRHSASRLIGKMHSIDPIKLIHEPDYDTPPNIFVQQSRMSSVSSSPDSSTNAFMDEYGDDDSENTAILAAVALLEKELEAEEELTPFLREVNTSSRLLGSRGIVILGVATLLSICSNISILDIRSTCEAFGSIDVFRGDFAASRGVIFVNYYDLRCAQYAAQELLGCLYRLAESEGVTSRSAIKLKLQYITPFNSSSATDESMIILSNLPSHVDEDSLAMTMGSYGAVKAVHFQVTDEDVVSYLVEFYDIQDAKQALLELESMNPWSSHVKMEVGKTNPSKRKKGKDLLGVIAKWRHGSKASTSVPKAISPGLSSLGASNHSHRSHNTATSRQPVAPVPTKQVQLVFNPESGQYSYVINAQQYAYQYTVPPPVIMPQYPINVPVPTLGNVIVSDNISIGSSIGNTSHKKASRNNLGSSNKSARSTGTNDVVVDETNLALDIHSVKRGLDKRTSLMVRNIPNKYTQQMLLAEFTQDGHGSHKIDFFYLPIDFKNKCNRGYAFVNFTNYIDIIAFHDQYNGKSWKIFNSDKICNITYARIQGKAALCKRFEHSAVLMEKEDEYRPLVFVSYGPDKGKREIFPNCKLSLDN